MQQPLRLLLTKFGLLALLLTGLSAHAQAPAWQTAAAAAGTVSVQATDTNGSSVYLVGNFSGTANFGGVILTTTNTQEAFVAKWSVATGAFVWAVQGTSTGTGSNSANAVVVGGGYVYVAGNFTTSTVKFGSGAALSNAQAGTSDIFLARVLDNGTSALSSLSRRAGGTGNDYANAITYAGIVFVGGSNSVSASFGTFTLPTAGGFVAAYSTAGTLFAAPVPMGANVMALASSPTPSSLYAAGSFNSSYNLFGNGSFPLTSAGGDDAFAARLTATAAPTLTWAQRAGGPGGDYARAIQANGSSVYVAGNSASASATYGSTTLTNAGTGVAFVAKLTDTNSAGTFAWALQNGGGTSPYNSANALSATGTSIYLAGSFGGTASFGGTTLTSAGGSDVVLAKLTDQGSSASVGWAQQAGGAGLDYANGVTRANTQVYTVGQVTPPATFGSQTIGAAVGARPGFLASVVDPAPVVTLAAPNIGPVGTTVALYGLNLTGATTITFTGTSNNVVTAGFTVNAAGTAITGIVVPGGAQSGSVTVTTPQGTSNGLVLFQVLPGANPAPAWQSVVLAGISSTIRWAQPDASGNVVVAGTFSGTLVLGSITLTNAGSTDLFVAKFNPATNAYVWAQRAGSSDYDDIYGLAVNGNNIYVAGVFSGQTATFGSTTLTTAFGNAGYVAKLTDAGSSAGFTWAQLLDDGGGVYLESLAVSGSSVYVGGEHFGTPLTLGTGTVAGNTSGDDGFIARFTDNGSTATFNWVKTMGGASSTSASLNTINVSGIVVKGSTVYLSGQLYGTVTFGSYTLTTQNSTDIGLVRLTDSGSTGTFTAALATGGTGFDYVQNMVGQGTALYLAGGTGSANWAGTSATNAGSDDAFVAKVTDTGTGLALSWVQLLGGVGNDGASQLAVNGTGIYVAGYFATPGTFGSTTLLGAGGSDGFVARLTDAGSSASVNWVQADGGAGADANYALALTPGKVHVGGVVTTDATFGPLVIASLPPLPTSVATLASLNDAAVLTTAPAAPASRLALYPNPAHGTATVQLPTGGTPGLSLLDVMGREVRRYPATPAAEATLDLQGVPAGLYVLRGAGSSGQKLVVE